MDIRDSYAAAAAGYAAALGGELAGKPLDRQLLDRFAEGVIGLGPVADLGCGPGQVAGYLHARGVEVFGLDLSPAMVREASRLHPGVEFRVGDLIAPGLPEASLAGAVAFYAIVHMAPDRLEPAFAAIRRAVRPGGLVLLAFHVGDEVIPVDELFGARVRLDFRFHRTERVAASLASVGLRVIETSEREPYPEVEHPSRRGYLLAGAE